MSNSSRTNNNNEPKLNAENDNSDDLTVTLPAKSGRGEEALERAMLIRAICHDVFPETTRRLGSGDKYRNMVSVFSPAIRHRTKRALYGKIAQSEFDPLKWLAAMNIDIGLKIEFLQIVARDLGDDWSNDSSSFLDVTIAMSRLQLLLRKLCQHELACSDFNQLGSAIIAVPPGEAHQFGQCIVEELFSTRGWTTELFVPETVEDLIAHIKRAQHDIVCISWSSTVLVDIVAQTIAAIEASDMATRPAIIAGGGASIEGSNWMVNLGVDCVCDSAYSAMNMAENLIAKKQLDTAD